MIFFFLISSEFATVICLIAVLLVIGAIVGVVGGGASVCLVFAKYANIIIPCELIISIILSIGIAKKLSGDLGAKSFGNRIKALLLSASVYVVIQTFFLMLYFAFIPEICYEGVFDVIITLVVGGGILIFAISMIFLLGAHSVEAEGPIISIVGCLFTLILAVVHCWFWIALAKGDDAGDLISPEQIMELFNVGPNNIMIAVRNIIDRIPGFWG